MLLYYIDTLSMDRDSIISFSIEIHVFQSSGSQSLLICEFVERQWVSKNQYAFRLPLFNVNYIYRFNSYWQV
jgi:hypothetical protein